MEETQDQLAERARRAKPTHARTYGSIDEVVAAKRSRAEQEAMEIQEEERLRWKKNANVRCVARTHRVFEM